MKLIGMIVVALSLLAPAAQGGETVFTCAADTHLSRRGDYFNSTTSTVDEGVWEWQIGSGATVSSVEALAARGMVHTATATGDELYGLAALATGDVLVSRYDANPTGFVYAWDIVFLAELCAFDESRSGGPTSSAYCAKAAEYFDRVLGSFPEPEDLVEWFVPESKSLAGWHVGWYASAAWRVGDTNFAEGVLDELLSRRVEWEHVPVSGINYTELSYGMFIRASFEMQSAGVGTQLTYADAVALANDLVATQEGSGAWLGGYTEGVAYILLGFRAHTTLGLPPPWLHATCLAREFIINSMSHPPGLCGENGTPEYAEVNSVLISGLAAMASMPFLDGFESGDMLAWSTTFP